MLLARFTLLLPPLTQRAGAHCTADPADGSSDQGAGFQQVYAFALPTPLPPPPSPRHLSLCALCTRPVGSKHHLSAIKLDLSACVVACCAFKSRLAAWHQTLPEAVPLTVSIAACCVARPVGKALLDCTLNQCSHWRRPCFCKLTNLKACRERAENVCPFDLSDLLPVLQAPWTASAT